jgi:iron-sulfur cluster assembly protein
MITISESATDQIKSLLAAEETPDMFLRLSVKAGGCSGFSYGMGFDDAQSEQDKEMSFHGLKVVVDSESHKFLDGV